MLEKIYKLSNSDIKISYVIDNGEKSFRSESILLLSVTHEGYN